MGYPCHALLELNSGAAHSPKTGIGVVIVVDGVGTVGVDETVRWCELGDRSRSVGVIDSCSRLIDGWLKLMGASKYVVMSCLVYSGDDGGESRL